MVVLVAKQAINTASLDLSNSSEKWKNGTGSVKAEKNGKLWYKITDIQAATAEKFEKLLKSPKKLFKSDDKFIGSSFDDTLKSFGGKDKVKAGDGDDTILGDGKADKLFGQGGDDSMFGGAGADLLSGGAGDNTLTGNKGSDSFLFDAPLNGGNAPFKPGNQSTITDFQLGVDTIQLDRSVFEEIGGKGKLPAKSLFLYPDPSKSIPEHAVIYDKAKGEIWYTKNGSVVDAVLFAKVTPDLELSNTDFLIV